MVKKGKAEAVAEIVPESLIQPTGSLQEARVTSIEPEHPAAESGKIKSRFAETRNTAVHDCPTSSYALLSAGISTRS